jgi:hypothetical protein
MIKKLLLLIVFSPLILLSQNFNGMLSSSLYGFQRAETPNSQKINIRAYQTAALNYNNGNFSLRTRANFETNIVNPLSQDPKLRVYNLYFELRKLFRVATLKVGRQFQINGVGSGVYDGVDFKIAHSGFSVTGFFGGNVPAYQKMEFTKDLKNDYLLSGKIAYNGYKNLYLSLYYVDKNIKSDNYYTTRLDANFNPVQVLIERNSRKYQYLSGKASYYLTGLGDISAKYDYDMNFYKTSLFVVNANYTKPAKFNFNFYYNFRNPLISYNSIFSVFNYANTQEVEGGIDYIYSSSLIFNGKFGYVNYKDANSERLTFGIRINYGTLSYRKTFGYEGELDAVSLYGARTLFSGVLTPSIGVSYTSYKLSQDSPKNMLLTLLAGVNYKPWKNLSFDLQGQFLNNKIYRNDVRVFAKVNYWFNTNF